MTSKLKCPVCKKSLEQVGTSRQYQCGSWGCDASFNMIGTESLWAAWTQAKQDLEIARKALDWLGNNRLAENPVRVEQLRQYARKALEQITHDISEKANSQEHKE